MLQSRILHVFLLILFLELILFVSIQSVYSFKFTFPLSWIITLGILYIVDLFSSSMNSFFRKIFDLSFVLTLSFLTLVNAGLYYAFGEFATSDMISIVFNVPDYINDYVNTYADLLSFTAFVILSAILFYLWTNRRSYKTKNITKYTVLKVLGIVLVSFVLLNQMNTRKNRYVYRSLLASSVLTARNIALEKVNHQLFLRPAAKLLLNKTDKTPKVKNVLLIVNESWGKRYVDTDKKLSENMPLLYSTLQSTNGFYFDSAFCNATATDVSMPSIFTGVGTVEDFSRLISMPFTWNWGSKLGRDTLFISSQRLTWAGLKPFFSLPGPTTFKIAEDQPYPTVNDLGIDDMLAAKTFIEETEKFESFPVVSVFNTNALHTPFQQTSKDIAKPRTHKSKYINALSIVDKAMEKIFNYMKEKGEFDNTLIIITADHGESDVKQRKFPRVAAFYDEIISVPFFVIPPRHWSKEYPEFIDNLEKNSKLSISNIDIAPTIVEALSLKEANKDVFNLFRGNSLLSRIEKERLIKVISTNDFRKWSPEGFALVKGPIRLVVSDYEAPAFFNIKKDSLQQNKLSAEDVGEVGNELINVVRSNSRLSRIYDLSLKN